MQRQDRHQDLGCRLPVWTLGGLAVLALCNLGLFFPHIRAATHLIDVLQFDRLAVLQGAAWRLLTGSLVHWSREHFLLDASAYLVVGLLAEAKLGRRYPWVLLAGSLFVGSAVLLFAPHLRTYRGLSGVDSAQFASLLIAECIAAVEEKRKWRYVAPALLLFMTKIVYECGTGELFFGTESLGDLGQPVPAAHAAGALA